MRQNGVRSNVRFPYAAKKAKGGSVGNSMIRQAQRNYRGSYISGDLGGVKVSNPSLAKYYGKKIPEVRPTCESHTDDKRRKGLCCQTKTSSR